MEVWFAPRLDFEHQNMKEISKMVCNTDDFRLAMRRFPASVCIVTTGTRPWRTGLTATAICSLSASPPQILVCLNAETGTYKAIQAHQRFAVNVLRPEHVAVARRFAGMGAEKITGDERFLEGFWQESDFGVPILSGALVVLECSLDREFKVSTHHILVGEVLNIPSSNDESALMYRNGAFGAWTPLRTHSK
jgi:flavin reductase (DIM6/NTAB) family NADH-FMN oxidoreductase RutF